MAERAAPGPRHLFVYGTLRPGHAPTEIASVVRALRTVGPARVRGRLYDLGPYPGAVLDATGATTIAGVVLSLPDDPSVLATIDRYEGFDPTDPERSVFVRARTSATLAGGRSLPCWVYVYNADPEAAAPPRPQPSRQRTK